MKQEVVLDLNLIEDLWRGDSQDKKVFWTGKRESLISNLAVDRKSIRLNPDCWDPLTLNFKELYDDELARLEADGRAIHYCILKSGQNKRLLNGRLIQISESPLEKLEHEVYSGIYTCLMNVEGSLRFSDRAGRSHTTVYLLSDKEMDELTYLYGSEQDKKLADFEATLRTLPALPFYGLLDPDFAGMYW